MEGDAPKYADQAAVTGDDISFMGTKADVLAARGDSTRLFDLAGKTSMPGFIDPHFHSVLGAAIRVSQDPTPAGTADRVHRRAFWAPIEAATVDFR